MWFRRWLSGQSDPVDGQPVDTSMLPIQIELADGSLVSQLSSVERWQHLAHLAPQTPRERPIFVDDLIRERHHRWYKEAWFKGRFRFDFLIAHGLEPRDRVLDLGCGAGRLGIWLIPYLEPGCYFGVDNHLRSLVAFSAYEMVLHGLAARRPRLLLDADFRVDSFGARFDVVIDVSVTRFLSRETFEQAYAQVRSVLAPGGRVFVSGLAPNRLEHLRSQGFEVWFEDSPETPPHFARRRPSSHPWHALRLVAPDRTGDQPDPGAADRP